MFSSSKEKCNSLFDFSGNNIAEYLHLTMSMSSESLRRVDSVFVDHSQSTVTGHLGIIVPMETDENVIELRKYVSSS